MTSQLFFGKKNNYNSLFLMPITEEVLNVVLNMNNKTSTDCYNINMEKDLKNALRSL